MTDAAGNVYVADWFFGTIDVDGGPGVHYVTSNGLKDALVVKYTAAEALVWARSFGGANEDVMQGLAVTGDGSLLVTGAFMSVVDFDPGVGVATRTAKGMVDLYVCKFDANGNFVWVQAAGGPGADQGVDVTVTPDGNVWATGVFQATVEL